MAYRITYLPKAEQTIRKLKRSNPVAFKKLLKLIPELSEHPRTGTGHPEPLKGEGGDVYSRHITAHDRLIYHIYEQDVVVAVVKVEGHYNDK